MHSICADKGRKLPRKFLSLFADKHVKPQCCIFIRLRKQEGLIASIRVSRGIVATPAEIRGTKTRDPRGFTRLPYAKMESGVRSARLKLQ